MPEERPHRGARLLAAACIVVCCATACAKIEAPSGGPPDTTVPGIVDSDPDSGAVSVRPDTLRIRFSKRMDRRSVRDALRIIPPIDVERMRWQESTLEVILSDPPDSGTTYTLFLGSGARDQKGNQLPTTSIPFSTGSELAAGSVEGQVLTGRIKAEGALVFASVWGAAEDSLLTEAPSPVGLGQVGKDGRFRISQLPIGIPLKICALYDARNDGAYDPDNDRWGCLEDAIALADSLRNVVDLTVYLVFEDEPGAVSGTVADSSCIEAAMRSAGLARESDSLTTVIRRAREARQDTLATDSLLAFGAEAAAPGDTTSALIRIADIDSLLAAGSGDSARCAIPIIVRLFASDTAFVAEARTTGAFEFRDLEPNVLYRIRAFRDADGNGQPGPGEAAGGYPFPVDLLPGRRITDLDIPLALTP